MSLNLSPQGPLRPPAVVNAEIRALVQAAWGRPFTDAERAVYQELRAEWTAAVRRPVAASVAA